MLVPGGQLVDSYWQLVGCLAIAPMEVSHWTRPDNMQTLTHGEGMELGSDRSCLSSRLRKPWLKSQEDARVNAPSSKVRSSKDALPQVLQTDSSALAPLPSMIPHTSDAAHDAINGCGQSQTRVEKRWTCGRACAAPSAPHHGSQSTIRGPRSTVHEYIMSLSSTHAQPMSPVKSCAAALAFIAPCHLALPSTDFQCTRAMSEYRTAAGSLCMGRPDGVEAVSLVFCLTSLTTAAGTGTGT
ncbi:hypothetical protein E4U53_001536 [Claviceps sorghi]|nr:hypothetical protein E4U53_001536 [Claviceps sorghi]